MFVLEPHVVVVEIECYGGGGPTRKPEIIMNRVIEKKRRKKTYLSFEMRMHLEPRRFQALQF